MAEYKIILTTLAPLHIGSGSAVKKQEYIYDPRNETVTFIDGAKLTKFLKQRNLLNKYLEYLSAWSSKADLKRFLFENNVKTYEWNAFESYKEKVYQGKKDGRMGPKSKDKPMNDIHTFIRDGRKEIYVPGSSLKGAIRTVLLKSIKEDIKQNKIFGKIKISDSKPISAERLAIYQKIDINKRDNPMPLYRESIKPETTIEFKMIVEDNIISLEDIEQSLKRFYNIYQQQWLQGFVNTDGGKEFFRLEETFKHHTSDESLYLYLGGGVGLVSKSLYYQELPQQQAKQEIFELLSRSFRKTYGKMKAVPDNVPVALKGTVDLAKNVKYQQGLCKIEIQKVK